MNKNERKVFFLKECKSPYIQEAIFFLKDGVDSDSKGVLADAERIVSAYMNKSPVSCEKHEKNIPLPFFLLVSSIALCSIFFGLYQMIA